MVDYILLHCEMTLALWQLMLSLFSVSWVLATLVREELFRWHGSFVCKTHKKTWLAVLLCIFWKILKKRNLPAFDDVDFSIQRMKIYFVCNLWPWSKMQTDKSSCSIVSFVDWLTF